LKHYFSPPDGQLERKALTKALPTPPACY